VGKRIPPDPKDLEASRDQRLARVRLERLEEYAALLRRASSLRAAAGLGSDDSLQQLIQSAEARRSNLQLAAEGRLHQRRRPKSSVPKAADNCLVFLDECGTHFLTSKDIFPVFCLAAVIIREAAYADLDLIVRGWKAQHLKQSDFVIHEPDIRARVGPWRDPGRTAVLEALRVLVEGLDFAVVACVVRRPGYVGQFGEDAPDDSLPAHPYLMTLDFLIERVVMVLETHFDGGRAKVIAESRGALEDARLQHEFARLHIEGTSYIASAWFRQQLHPGIHFEPKGGSYASGLQLADLSARPVAEKVAVPTSTPDRWPEICAKLCRGQETKNSILGLKIMPWDAAYAELWKS
jgi:hypothetical protein